jgi:phosphatidylcholine synthase
VRVERWRPVNLAVLVVWAALALMAVIDQMAPDAWITGALCAIGVYVFFAGLLFRAS